MKSLNIKTPADLGKIRYKENIIPSEIIKKDFLVNLILILFLLFGSSISILMFIHFFKTGDFVILLFACCFFITFFPLLYYNIATFLSTNIYIVCDRGIAIYEYGINNKIKNQEFFYFKPHYSYEIKELENYHSAGKYKYTYTICVVFLENQNEVYEISYTCVSKDIVLTERKKLFFDEALLAFKIYKYKYKG